MIAKVSGCGRISNWPTIQKNLFSQNNTLDLTDIFAKPNLFTLLGESWGGEGQGGWDWVSSRYHDLLLKTL